MNNFFQQQQENTKIILGNPYISSPISYSVYQTDGGNLFRFSNLIDNRNQSEQNEDVIQTLPGRTIKSCALALTAIVSFLSTPSFAQVEGCLTQIPQDGSPVAFSSQAFPDVYLRLDGRDVTQPLSHGGGTVNSQFGAGPWEKFCLGSNGTASNRSNAFAGAWLYQGKPGPVISVSGNNVTIDMSAYNRPAATGRIIGDNKISVTFPDDDTFTGELVYVGQIKWSNSTVWNR
ncbi:MAG: hypothetical protein F6K37_36525 [Moorea sp. SIO4E2]|uniref:hypothetical protein n=1 Tax=Moorena sp. SIO4E2 TaxID=2607826 RepID=UPI0013B925BB|nr:hypothetical protein [Moorena sp. SIO4E2]NEQ11214.1 hypothetical protein [Moorena sp. SIO4E2]